MALVKCQERLLHCCFVPRMGWLRSGATEPSRHEIGQDCFRSRERNGRIIFMKSLSGVVYDSVCVCCLVYVLYSSRPKNDEIPSHIFTAER